MNKIYYIACTSILVAFIACTGKNGALNKNDPSPKNISKQPMQNINDYKEGKDYSVFERVRISDNMGFTSPVEAYSLLLPKGWKYEGNINWVYGTPGAGIGTYNYFKATSPDNKYQFEMLPEITWSWVSDPQLLQMMQANTNSQYAFVAEPMDAEQYLRNVFVNQELNNAIVGEVKPNNSVMEEMQQNFANARNELMMYGAADVQFYPSAITAALNWNNGQEGIAMCGVTMIETTIMNQYNGSMQKTFTSSAVKRIVFRFPKEEKQNAENMLTAILGSIRTNTAWKNNVDAFWKQSRQNSNMVHRQKIQMMDEQTRAIANATISKGAQSLKNMDMNLRSWEEGQASQDRMNTNFIKAIREVENYQDATGKIELSSGYNHAWSRGDGTNFILSNDPNFNPSSTFQDQSWTEMKPVE